MPDQEPKPAPPEPVSVIVRKAEMEAAMLAAPDDLALRAAYFDLLLGLSASNSGLLFAHLPELEAPLAFRPGTPDLPALAEVFRDNVMAIAMAPTPLRILVLGAYAGYTAVDLARRYPRAAIAAVEPQPDNLRLLRLNTGAWRRIRVVPVAAWHSAARLAPIARFQAEWSVRFADEGLDAYRVVPALPVPDLLAEVGWDHADMVVCDITGTEREIFNDRWQSWLGHVDALLIRLYDFDRPPSSVAVRAAFPPEHFEHRKEGNFDLFVRRVPRTKQPRLPAELALLRSDPGVKPFRLSEVPQTAWGFFIFDGGSCQLHPSGVAERPSRAIFGVPDAGYLRFQSDIVHAGLVGADPIVFSVFVVRNDGTVAAQASAKLTAQQSGRLTMKLPEIPAPFHIVLQTEMAPDAVSHRLAWARWLEPRLI